jgi:hypothetical protein
MRRGHSALVTIAAALAAACAHAPRPEVSRAAADLRCEDASRSVAARARTRPLDDLRRSATLPLSLVASGAGWVTDGATVVSAGVVVGGLVCTPILALEVAAKSNGSASGECFLRVGSAVIAAAPAPGLGRGVYRVTRSWRCPDFLPLAREVRAVAACYGARGAPGDREVGLDHLDQLRGDREIWACLPHAERREVEAARARLLVPATPAEPVAPSPAPARGAPPDEPPPSPAG